MARQPGSSTVAIDPVCATSGGATSGVPDSCQSMSNTYCAEPLASRVASAVGVRSSGRAARNQLHPRAFDVVDDAAAAVVVADVGEEVDAAAQPGQADRDVERAAADVLAV